MGYMNCAHPHELVEHAVLGGGQQSQSRCLLVERPGLQGKPHPAFGLELQLPALTRMNLGPPERAPSLAVVITSSSPFVLPSSGVGYHLQRACKGLVKGSASSKAVGHQQQPLRVDLLRRRVPPAAHDERFQVRGLASVEM